MTDSAGFLAALRNVEQHGDVAPPAASETPSNVAARHRACLENLIAWDDARGRFVLTATGRTRLTGATRVSATVTTLSAFRRASRP
ncbi:MAG TPA: hypothetical protein P5256_17010 [Beijerinckiaceae bacterium]|nr:hypothetical protein [Rhodoblastus sp.]HRY04836.1 hypothetical protein [Beijerinckiaceae bacterium]